MGCFLACFGYSKNRKRRKHLSKNLELGQKFVSYEPLQSSLSKRLDPEEPISSNSELRGKTKESSSQKIRKKVSFNLNVVTYEPIPDDESTLGFLESEDQKNSENETAYARGSPLPSEGDDSTKMGSYPENYRYRNCRDSYDDEDEMLSAESDLDDYEDDDIDDEDDDELYGDAIIFDHEISQKEFSVQRDSASAEPPLAQDNSYNLRTLQHITNQEFKAEGSTQNARDRSQYLQSVMKPVENLSQWKAVKARTAPQFKHQRKENIVSEQEQIPFSSKPTFNSLPCSFSERLTRCKHTLQDIAVDASLSNWIASSENVSATKNNSFTVATMPLKENMLGSSNSVASKERDRTL